MIYLKKKIVRIAGWCTAVILFTGMINTSLGQTCDGVRGKPLFTITFGNGTGEYEQVTPEYFGFSTTYTQIFGNTPGAVVNDGYFSFVNVITDYFGVWHGGGKDHTGDPGGYMLLVNADFKPGEFFRDTISGLCPGTNYTFSAWITNVFVVDPNAQKPDIKFSIQNTSGVTLDSFDTGNIPAQSNMVWKQYMLTFTATASKVILLMTNNNKGGYGNDLAIDDISFAPCLPGISLSNINACAGEDISIPVTSSTALKFHTPQYQWQKKGSAGWGSVTGANISGVTSSSLNIANATLSDSGWYRVIVAEPGNLDSASCRTVDSMKVMINPDANAGPDSSICDNQGSINLKVPPNGQIWSVLSSPKTVNLSASSGAVTGLDKAGAYKFILANSSGAACPDTVVVTTYDPPVITLRDTTLCQQTPEGIVLSPGLSHVSAVSWTGGAGSFSPNRQTESPTYTPTTGEVNAGSLMLYLNATGQPPCAAVKDSMKITINNQASADAGPDQDICGTQNTVSLSGTYSNGTVNWTGGGGAFSSANSATTTYTPSASDIQSGSVKLYLNVQATAPCQNVKDSLTIKIEPQASVDAGTGTLLCETRPDIKLSGTSQKAHGVIWSGGMGTFSPNAKTLTATYTPSSGEITSGTVTLTLSSTGSVQCPEVNDKVTYTILKAPTVDAGPDQDICETQSTVSLSGTYSNGTVNWTGGGGSFSSANSATSTYTPSASDIQSGSVKLYLNVQATAPCQNVKDSLTVKIEPQASVDAGTGTTLCETSPDIKLSGTSQKANGVIWSGGTGTFSPDAKTLTATYTPSSGEITSGTVTLTLSSTGSVQCPEVNDKVTYTILKAPTVDAGSDQDICETQSTVSLSGTYSNGTVNWTGGGGAFSSANSATSTYTPSASDIQSDSVKLYLNVQASAPCQNVKDSLSIKIEPQASVDAGTGTTLCETSPDIKLSGTSQKANGVIWSGGTGTFSPDAKTLTATYTPSSGEVSSGTVTLKLSSTGSVECPEVNDQVTYNFAQAPTVNAGPDDTVCANNALISLKGTLTVAGGAVWQGGSGSFSPDRNSLSGSYLPSDSEISAGKIQLILVTTQNGVCSPVQDTVIVYVKLAPAVKASDRSICPEAARVALSGSAQNTDSTRWSGGGGAYNPSVSSLTPEYMLTSAEKDQPFSLVLTGYRSGCKPVHDSVQVVFYASPVASLPNELDACYGNTVKMETPLLSKAIYQWKKDGILQPQTGNTLTAVAATQPVIFTVLVTDSNACKNTDSVLVKGMPFPILDVKDQAVCQGDEATFNGVPVNVDSLTASLGYAWYLNNKRVGISTQLTTKEVGTYRLVVSAGQCTVSDTATLVLWPHPSVDLPQSVKFCEDNESSITLDAGEGTRFFWLPVKDSSKLLQVNASGTYYLTKWNQYGCESQGEVQVKEVCPPSLYLSNAFSPNSDHTNDLYKVYPKHVGKFEMLIFNRWGEIIFESKDPHYFWDGSYRGEPMPIGVYPWIITYEGDSEEYRGPYKMEGSVTVVR